MRGMIKVRLVYEVELPAYAPWSSERSEVFMEAVTRLEDAVWQAEGELDPTRAVFKEVIIE